MNYGVEATKMYVGHRVHSKETFFPSAIIKTLLDNKKCRCDIDHFEIFLVL